MHVRDATFGYNATSHIPNESANNLVVTQYIKEISNITGYVSIICSIALVILAGLSLINPLIAVGVIVGLSLVYVVTQVYVKTRASQIAGIVFNNNEIRSLKLAPKYRECEAIATQHSADTELWRKRLIESAEHNIVISGNYCGGDSFIDFLHLVEKRIQERPQLKVVILSSPQFLTGKCKIALKSALTNYPSNISLISCPSIWHVSPGIKQTTNHTKGMVIDYGKYCILGGSGIRTNFTQTGLYDLTKEEFLRNEGEPVPPVEAEENGFMSRILPRNFRDQDWVFSCQESPRETNSIGTQTYKQLLLLAHRWEMYNKTIKNSGFGEVGQTRAKNLGLFSGISTPIQANDTITTQLLKTPVPKLHQLKTHCPAFENSAKKITKVVCKVFASGPEQSKSSFATEVLDGINKATKEIVINHMYFHPTADIMNALIRAAQRGVTIKILTCGVYDISPVSHKIFAPRNKYNYSYLMNALTPEQRKKVSIFEFRGNNISNHKKLIVIDKSTVIAGSSNLGYKSLVTASDHELNFIAKSKKLAQETLKICKIDEEHSQKVIKDGNERWTLSFNETCRAINHRLFAPLIG